MDNLNFITRKCRSSGPLNLEIVFCLVAVHQDGPNVGVNLLDAMVTAAENIFGDAAMSEARTCVVRTLKTSPTPDQPRFGRQVVDHGADMLVLRGQHHALRQLARCVAMRWLAILVGPTDSGTCDMSTWVQTPHE